MLTRWENDEKRREEEEEEILSLKVKFNCVKVHLSPGLGYHVSERAGVSMSVSVINEEKLLLFR